LFKVVFFYKQREMLDIGENPKHSN